jgi:hypothetical protein
MRPPPGSDFCEHYRTMETDMDQTYESIRNLNVDFEYMTYILKSYSKFC